MTRRKLFAVRVGSKHLLFKPQKKLVALLLLLVRPGAPSSVLAPSSDALCS